MNDGYPEEHELEKIRSWEIRDKQSLDEMIEFIKSVWWSPDFGFKTDDDGKLYLSTGGWSGNEDIIDAMDKNHIFWWFCWEQSRRGGHYIFDLNKIK
jgi:hypothetical protein